MLCHTHGSVESGLDPRQFLARRVGTDRLLPVARPDETGQPIDSLDAALTRPCHYLAYAETSAIGRAVDNMLRHSSRHLQLDRVFVSRLAAVLKSMASDGRGLAWLPESQIAEELAGGQLMRAGGTEWDLEVEITIFRPRDRLPEAAEAFWTIVEAETPLAVSARAISA